MIKSRICDLLGIDYPIISGGMTWVSSHTLVAAVSEAGGFGVIGAGAMTPAGLREEIKKTRDLTKKAFGVNLILIAPEIKGLIEVVCEERVPAVFFGAGSPGVFIKDLKAFGIKVFPVVSSVALARRLERSGADGIVAEGCEAGGHIGELTTLVLLPQVVSAVGIPVIAAGGFAEGRQVVCAFILGAEAVQIGTRFIVTRECRAHPNFKQKIINARDRDTVVTGRSVGFPTRVIKNKMSREFLKMEREGVPFEEIERLTLDRLRAAVIDGDLEMGSLMAGQVSGMIKKEEPAAQIIQDIMTESERHLKNAPGLVIS